MRYCVRCVYPANARPAITFDERGICSGCVAAEKKLDATIDWATRWKALKDLTDEHHEMQRAKRNPFDCIIPVSGGKDSHFQTYVVTRKLGLNPLLVAYNHAFNTVRGIRNLANLVTVFNCHLVRFSTPLPLALKLARFMLETCGDVTWHYHAGIMTFPIQAAVQYDVPLIIWGEEGFSELVGMYDPLDMVEFTRKKRTEHSMRGIEPEELIEQGHFTRYELAPFLYPSDEVIEDVGVRGIYLSNYMPWDSRRQAEMMVSEAGFEPAGLRQRTFNPYSKLDCLHANGLHDWLKFLKFGYGRATDDASLEIRHRRMDRDTAINLVLKYDHVRPRDTDVFLRAVNMTEDELLRIIEPMRDSAIWERGLQGPWHLSDLVGNHRNDDRAAVEWVPMTPLIAEPKSGADGYVVM